MFIKSDGLVIRDAVLLCGAAIVVGVAAIPAAVAWAGLTVAIAVQRRRRRDGASTHDRPPAGSWPRRRVIWSCQADRGPLLTRYYLCECAVFAVYLHHLHASDEDRALHDHPWSFLTLLFHRGYTEHTPDGAHWRRRFSLLWRPATWQHRLTVTAPTWTLVLRLRKCRPWGFITARGWQGWREYGREWCD